MHWLSCVSPIESASLTRKLTASTCLGLLRMICSRLSVPRSLPSTLKGMKASGMVMGASALGDPLNPPLAASRPVIDGRPDQEDREGAQNDSHPIPVHCPTCLSVDVALRDVEAAYKVSLSTAL
jgi:hypothetical protein